MIFFSFFLPLKLWPFLGMTALSLHFFRDESQSSFFSKNASHRFLSYFFWSMSIVSIKNTQKNTCRNHICNCYFNWKPVVAFLVALWLSENSTVWGPSFAFGEVCTDWYFFWWNFGQHFYALGWFCCEGHPKYILNCTKFWDLLRQRDIAQKMVILVVMTHPFFWNPH